MVKRITIGTKISIPIGNLDTKEASHEVVGYQHHYLLICPISKLDKIEPGQYWTPVSRITPDRVRVR